MNSIIDRFVEQKKKDTTPTVLEVAKNHYVEKYGLNILAIPPASGFNLLMWIIPIIFGLFGITILYKYFFD